MDLQILDVRSRKKLCLLENTKASSTIGEVKALFAKKYPKFYVSRQSFRLEKKGKSLKDSMKLKDIEFVENTTLLFKDLGTQVGWSTVFYTEYAGPLFIYLLFYIRPSIIYGSEYARSKSEHYVVHVAAICHSVHYIKRLLETKFVHRFSHGTMPLMNIFKNSTYYWMFAAWQAYLINHPQTHPPMFGYN
jgi:very-long-chain enoyl-CoA reductase